MCMFLFEYIMYMNAFIRFHEYVRMFIVDPFFSFCCTFSHGPTNLVIVAVDFLKKKSMHV